MVKNILLGFTFLGLAVASAASSYNITFYQPVMVNGSELKAGEYKLELKDKTAVLKQGKTAAEVPVTVENDGQKFARTSVRLEGMQVEEIRIGGTNTRVIFGKSNATN
ncbi:MAG: hypothetical protein ACLPWF_08705 [Bryobacteraceae bacterium]